MAGEIGPVPIGVIRRALPAHTNPDELVRRLVGRGHIFRVGRGAYDFALPMFRAYLHRRGISQTHRSCE